MSAILAARRTGELLKGVIRNQGKRDKGLRATLAQSHISEHTGRRWQAMVAVSEATIRKMHGEMTEGLRPIVRHNGIGHDFGPRWTKVGLRAIAAREVAVHAGP